MCNTPVRIARLLSNIAGVVLVSLTFTALAAWNSLSVGLPLALTMPPRALGTPARLIAGTTAGVWEYTATTHEDSDGSPSVVENSVLAGDGNGDGTADSMQSNVASTSASSSSSSAGTSAPEATLVRTTIEIMPGICNQLNDSTSQPADLYPPDPLGTPLSHEPWGLVSFSLPDCSQATVRVTFHGANFGADWKWRNYGPRIPGNAATFGWYTFAGARLINQQTWEPEIDASRQGNYRDNDNNILFIGVLASCPSPSSITASSDQPLKAWRSGTRFPGATCQRICL